MEINFLTKLKMISISSRFIYYLAVRVTQSFSIVAHLRGQAQPWIRWNVIRTSHSHYAFTPNEIVLVFPKTKKKHENTNNNKNHSKSVSTHTHVQRRTYTWCGETKSNTWIMRHNDIETLTLNRPCFAFKSNCLDKNHVSFTVLHWFASRMKTLGLE